MKTFFGPHYPKPDHWRLHKSVDAYLEAAYKWIEESEKWKKFYYRQLYVLVRHCGFNEDLFWTSSPQAIQWKIDMWNEEQEKKRKEYEKGQQRHQAVMGRPGGLPNLKT